MDLGCIGMVAGYINELVARQLDDTEMYSF